MKHAIIDYEAIVIGGGIAGLATCIHLARAGMNVVCIHSDELGFDPVGESLDWSSPSLLHEIGLPIEALISAGIATSKQHVVLKLQDGCQENYAPGLWLGEAPFNVRLDTIHADRGELDRCIREIAERAGVHFLSDQVVEVEQHARRVLSIVTKQGRRLRGRWFIDASGSKGRLFARAFHLPMREYGPAKVAMWDYFPVAAPLTGGTTLYCSPSSTQYMHWIWEIPIRPDLVSIGSVATGEEMKKQRQEGLDLQQIYEQRLNQYPALASLLETKKRTAPRVTSFRCRVHAKVSGPNWLIVGEAASMVDPMTSNGVTAALRHAREASALIIRSRKATRLPRFAAAAYAWRVRDVAAFFNSLVETVMYETPIRSHAGPMIAARIYTIPAWLLNLFYSRMEPRGVISSLALGMLLRLLRSAATTCSWICQAMDGVSRASQPAIAR